MKLSRWWGEVGVGRKGVMRLSRWWGEVGVGGDGGQVGCAKNAKVHAREYTRTHAHTHTTLPCSCSH